MRKNMLIILMLCVLLTGCNDKKSAENKTNTSSTSTTISNQIDESTTSRSTTIGTTVQQSSTKKTTLSTTTTKKATTTKKTTTNESINQKLEGCWKHKYATLGYTFIFGNKSLKSKGLSVEDNLLKDIEKNANYLFVYTQSYEGYDEGHFFKYSISNLKNDEIKLKLDFSNIGKFNYVNVPSTYLNIKWQDDNSFAVIDTSGYKYGFSLAEYVRVSCDVAKDKLHEDHEAW